MRLVTTALAATFVLSGTLAHAQVPKGHADPRPAPSVNSNKDTSGMTPDTRSGSGTSTSGGRDATGDQGRDKAPYSNMDVKPSPGKPDIPNPNSKIK
jgi:hypothetical protein